MKKGFIFIETIIVICVLTVGLMSLYKNYSTILVNTKEQNTFDTSEYNYKTYFLKKLYLKGNALQIGEDTYNNPIYLSKTSEKEKCYTTTSPFSDNSEAKICLLTNITDSGTIYDYLNKTLADGTKQREKFDAYIIDYLLSQDFNEKNDDIFLVKYKKNDKQNKQEYFTYVSSLNY